MIKIFLTILVVYLLYYAGNIIYDLFLKKDTASKEEEAQEYALAALTEQDKAEIEAVSIDDVEHLNTPNSFNAKELFSSNDKEPDEPHDLEHWREKFESEQDIDAFEIAPQIDEQLTESKEVPQDDWVEEEIVQGTENGISTNPTSVIADNADSRPENESPSLKLKQQFNQFLSLAETQVQVLSDRDGFKVYHSMI
ncbi:hypothetical protein ACFO4P_08350 [Epilithonimonas pallida]|uniref:Uncharacterized protein n=1 Tax=Epilithonimonas pallida TaxID=373671 RepID=A0ABY1R2Z5_9FLAO|nr:hypothetical protein [Epilithonimonas pallida]SMP93814.1 hypothetical protein SAMN05421679_105119 [Epilithonimonas pallida]